MSIPNIDIIFFSIPHEDNLSITYLDKNFLSICHIDNLSTCGIDKKIMSILGIDKLSILLGAVSNKCPGFLKCLMFLRYRFAIFSNSAGHQK